MNQEAQSKALEEIASAQADYSVLPFPEAGLWADGESYVLQKQLLGTIKDLVESGDKKRWQEWKQGFDDVFPANTENRAELCVKRAYDCAVKYFEHVTEG